MKPIVKSSCFCQSLENGARGGAKGGIVIGIIMIIASSTMLSIIAYDYASGNRGDGMLFGFIPYLGKNFS